MMKSDPKEPLQFSCFDDHDNDGWGNPLQPRDDRDEEIEEEKEEEWEKE